MQKTSSRLSANQSTSSRRASPQLVDAETFLNEGRGRRLFPEKYRSNIQFGDGITSVSPVRRSLSANAHNANSPRRTQSNRLSARDAVTSLVDEPVTRPQRRPRGPGTTYARLIEANGFPEDAARRHHGDDVAARERLRPFYTVQNTGDPASRPRTAKKIHQIEFGRDRTDVHEALNLFDRQENLRWAMPVVAEARELANRDARCARLHRSPQSAHKAREEAPRVAAQSPPPPQQQQRDGIENHSPASLHEQLERQSMRVAYLERLLKLETEKLLIMAQEVQGLSERNSVVDDSPGRVDQEDATTDTSELRMPPVPRAYAPRRPQPWELHAGEHSAAEETSADSGTCLPRQTGVQHMMERRQAHAIRVADGRGNLPPQEAVVDDEDDSEDSSGLGLRRDRLVREYSHHNTNTGTRHQHAAVKPSSPPTANVSRIRVLAHDVDARPSSASSSSSSSYSSPSIPEEPPRHEQPVASFAPRAHNWKAQLIAKVRDREEQYALRSRQRWQQQQPPEGLVPERSRSHTRGVAAQVSRRAWEVPFPDAEKPSGAAAQRTARPFSRQERHDDRCEIAAPVPTTVTRPSSSPLSARATMRGRSCERSQPVANRGATPRPQSASFSLASPSPVSRSSFAEHAAAQSYNSHAGHSLLDVLTQSGTGSVGVPRPASRGRGAQPMYVDDSFQSLRDVLGAGAHRRQRGQR